ncbi:TPA: N-acetylglucosamine-6-phosphate deacetylase [Klebsiella aerogenes]|uniref:N-acetylglucosamine-6-phosphate deacetylase n=1 Tax=Klebsiella TaxID=570 RepID=UPI00277BF238|nr:N-acetylglucosamine-6-phosphate deacetylase [Klebsiella sp. 141203]MDU9367436.1 N-acetylglucosamine-6-phosphate deacetylase [Klebsiella sp. 141203]HDS7116030.1 N-acetylglucosamine-6-phosphate deacetylase [Klebsiella aerogenes]HDT5519304.1 N-acetylglucosamine-6-phosphate deacetylase [Klebsiella aerogenes]HEP0588135.1 N-acetylglucosamine-6-phosphate deacetylase [Klebsiella aerogenes]
MIIQSERVWLAGGFYPAQITIEDGLISAITPGLSSRVDKDYGARRIIPGLIDSHAHGAWDYDTNENDPQGLRRWASRLPEEGVTAFCPTTVTDENATLLAALDNISRVMDEGYSGAEILGIHLEGPFLSQLYRGAQPEKQIRPADVTQFQAFEQAARDRIIAITLAPEEDHQFALTRYCAQKGIAVNMGHSDASFEQALAAVANGAKNVTHVYNGMAKYVNREPGLLGAALNLDGLYGEVIADGIFVSLVAAAHLYRSKNDNDIIMISDSMKAKGCPPGRYMFGGEPMVLGDDGATRRDNGVLVGSTLQLNRGLYNMVERAMVPFSAALKSCTINPARLLGFDSRKGKLQRGYDADIVVLEDNYQVNTTYCRGTVAWSIN